VNTRLGIPRIPLGALWSLLLLCGLSWPSAAEDPKSLTGILITARDELPDPNFEDSIVLVVNDLGPAPVGIIINRPTPIAVSKLFPELKRLAELPDKVYFGGPVEFESVWFLVRTTQPPEHAVKACDGVYVSMSRELLLRLLHRDKPMEGLRIFLGHSGWAPGQLEEEIGDGDWTLRRADAAAIFDNETEHPWPSVESSNRST
jgi:putative transcriptional regulator